MKFFERVCSLLPVDIVPEEIKRLAPSGLWARNDYIATAYALRKHKRINWQAYLERNPDVKQSGMDACLHFLKHGVFEGRELVSWHPLRRDPDSSAPLVSVIVTNYNNADYLERSLQSVMEQTIQGIEIIIIDDASTDKSEEIITNFVAVNTTIKFIRIVEKAGSFQAKKIAVKHATGSFVMFLNSQDRLMPEACKIAVNYITRGYDIVAFCMYIYDNLHKQYIDAESKYSNSISINEQVYSAIELRKMMANNKCMNYLWTKIYLREIIEAAYDDLPDLDINIMADLPVSLAVTKYARDMLKVNHRLYQHNINMEEYWIDCGSTEYEQWFGIADTFWHTEKYIRNAHLDFKFGSYKLEYAANAVWMVFECADNSRANVYWNKIIKGFGEDTIIEVIADKYWSDINYLSGRLPRVVDVVLPRVKIKKIGIIVNSLSQLRNDKAFLSLIRLMRKRNYEITIFRNSSEYELPQQFTGAKIVDLPPAWLTSKDTKDRAFALRHALKSIGIDLLLNICIENPAALWDALIANMQNIPIIALMRRNFLWYIQVSPKGYKHWNYTSLFYLYAQVIVPDSLSEAYYRLKEINASAISRPPNISCSLSRIKCGRDLIYCGDLGDSWTQASKLLDILYEILNYYSDVKLYLIGDFKDANQVTQFAEKIATLSLGRHVHLLDSNADKEHYLKQCSIFISASVHEAVDSAILDALAAGLPCIIYDLPMDQADNNPAIIRVPQGESFLAAQAVIGLFEDPERYQRLSEKAIQSVKSHSTEEYANLILECISSCNKHSEYRKYDTVLFKKLINYLAWYSQHRSPT